MHGSKLSHATYRWWWEVESVECMVFERESKSTLFRCITFHRSKSIPRYLYCSIGKYSQTYSSLDTRVVIWVLYLAKGVWICQAQTKNPMSESTCSSTKPYHCSPYTLLCLLVCSLLLWCHLLGSFASDLLYPKPVLPRNNNTISWW